MRFLDLKKNLKKDFSALRKVRVAILGDSATQFLAQAIRGYGYECGFDLTIFEADYGQIDRQVFDSTSDLYSFQPEFVVIFRSAQKLLKSFYSTETPLRNQFAKTEAGRITDLIAEFERNCSGGKVLFLNFAEIDDGIFGNFANKTDLSFLFQTRLLNCELMALSQRTKNLFICDAAVLSNQIGAKNAIDNRLYVEADMVFNLDFLPLLAKSALDVIQALSGMLKKCLILDLDNTLWGGIIGDDGIENIEIGDLGRGKAFSELQAWAKELKKRGVMLAICSKNDEAIAKQPFEAHPDMVLSLEDIAIFVANWDSKVQNIEKIRSFLNIGYDAMVFIDDNPYERGVVKHHLPTVTVPELPEDPVDYLSYLRSLNLFETVSYTEEDAERTTHFQLELKREVAQRSFSSENDFLESLGMACEICHFQKFNIPRAAQLIQRSNQFNLRTIRYGEQDLERIAASPEYFHWTFSVEDKFGSYGLISVIIGRVVGEALFLDTWVMSCRVLKRGVEFLALNEIVASARKKNLLRIIGEYLPTAKNALVKEHYAKLGFSPDEQGRWVLDVESYNSRPHFIAATTMGISKKATMQQTA